ncbi:copper resistance CopC family protein [Nesterenkonia ebinurensis]|uniref:copper resistance CopC family protein n=1 Tax=Nesterenkonia ebinurensis TaxID=2608252 RepID=UPI00123CD14F|nr:copper resistance CopC family protein [Nesterenkonia ebinurensis]
MHTASSAPVRLRLAALSGTAALVLATLTAAPAQAHDTLISSSPEEGEVLTQPPVEVVLEFSGSGLTTGDAITNDIWVLDSEEENWASEDPAEVEGSTMRTEIPEPLPNGEYEVAYRVVYSDGHSEEHSFSFEVDLPLTEDESGTQTPEVEVIEEDTEAPAAAEPELTQEESPVTMVDSEDDEDSGGWGGIIGWGLLAAAVLALAAVGGYAVSRRRRQ